MEHASPPRIVGGSANPALAAAVARELGGAPVERFLERFPDGEIRAQVRELVSGRDVWIVQPTCPPVGEHLLELLLLADACRRAGAARVFAVIPYFGYARQDRRVREGEPIGARVLGDLVSRGRFDRVLLLDLHVAAVEGLVEAPVEHLTAEHLLVEELRHEADDGCVVVSPDLGAAKLAEHVASALGLPLVVCHKVRQSGSDVTVQGIVGDPAGLRPLIVDDLISTGHTLVAACRELLRRGAVADVTLAATHGLFSGTAAGELATLPLRRVIVTDSLPCLREMPFRMDVVGIAPLVAEAIRRLTQGLPLGGLLAAR